MDFYCRLAWHDDRRLLPVTSAMRTNLWIGDIRSWKEKFPESSWSKGSRWWPISNGILMWRPMRLVVRLSNEQDLEKSNVYTNVMGWLSSFPDPDFNGKRIVGWLWQLFKRSTCLSQARWSDWQNLKAKDVLWELEHASFYKGAQRGTCTWRRTCETIWSREIWLWY